MAPAPSFPPINPPLSSMALPRVSHKQSTPVTPEDIARFMSNPPDHATSSLPTADSSGELSYTADPLEPVLPLSFDPGPGDDKAANNSDGDEDKDADDDEYPPNLPEWTNISLSRSPVSLGRLMMMHSKQPLNGCFTCMRRK